MGWVRAVACVSWAVAVIAGCGGAPLPPENGADESPRVPPRRAADVPDECVQQPGKPPPPPLSKEYTGVAAKARCQREVYKIMGGLTHFLGVRCGYCHIERDYSIMTHRKRIANWMARELIPALREKAGRDVWCNDCHVVSGKGTAKILGNPRDVRWAAEWMTTHLAEDFEAADGRPLRCKSCHRGNVGTPEFQPTLILRELPLSGHAPDAGTPPPEAASPEPESAAADAGAD